MAIRPGEARIIHREPLGPQGAHCHVPLQAYGTLLRARTPQSVPAGNSLPYISCKVILSEAKDLCVRNR